MQSFVAKAHFLHYRRFVVRAIDFMRQLSRTLSAARTHRRWLQHSSGAFAIFVSILAAFTVGACARDDELDRAPVVKFLLLKATSGSADLTELADKVCIVPPSVVRQLAPGLFPDFHVAYRDDLQSEGRWYLLLGDNSSRRVRVISMRQSEIEWAFDENATVAELITCDPIVRLRPSGHGRAIIIPNVAKDIAR
jgi:hypothetical protein